MVSGSGDYRRWRNALQWRWRVERSAARRAWQNRRMIPWLVPDRRSRRSNRRWTIRTACWRRATTCPDRLLEAYRHGIFPWYSEGQPVLWWSPDPRMVLFVDEFRVARSLRKAVRRRQFEIRVDTAFRATVEGCAARRAAGRTAPGSRRRSSTRTARCTSAGYAHSVEAWRDGRLVGGLYGVAIGRMFFGESMFARETDASKVALAHLVRDCTRAGVSR